MSSSVKICFKSASSAPPQDCLQFKEPQNIDSSESSTTESVNEPGSHLHQSLPNLKSTSVCYHNLGLLSSDKYIVSHQFHVFTL